MAVIYTTWIGNNSVFALIFEDMTEENCLHGSCKVFSTYGIIKKHVALYFASIKKPVFQLAFSRGSHYRTSVMLPALCNAPASGSVAFNS